jgi:hypothetical protein
MKITRGRVTLAKIRGTAKRSSVRRAAPRPPKVNPRVTAEQALRVLRNFRGGDKVIEQLRQAGKKI